MFAASRGKASKLPTISQKQAAPSSSGPNFSAKGPSQWHSATLRLNLQFNGLQRELRRSLGQLVAQATWRARDNSSASRRASGATRDGRASNQENRRPWVSLRARARLGATCGSGGGGGSLRRSLSERRPSRQQQQQQQQQLSSIGQSPKWAQANGRLRSIALATGATLSRSSKEPKDEPRRQQQRPASAAERRQQQHQLAQASSAGRPRKLLGSFQAIQQQHRQRSSTTSRLLAGAHLMFVCALLATCRPTEAAPVPSSLVRPIWLSEGLITVDPSGFQQQQLSTQQEPVGLLAGDLLLVRPQLVEADAAATKQAEPDSQGSEPLGLLGERPPLKRGAWLMRGPLEQQQLQLQLEEQPGELLWIERRRLERDRAQEPAGWLRDRPIRRDPAASGPASRAAPPEPGQSEPRPPPPPPLDTVAASPAPAAAQAPIRARLTRGRHAGAQQVGGEFYEEILRQLIKEALERGADELEEGESGAGSGQQEEALADLESRVQSRRMSSTATAQEEPDGLVVLQPDVAEVAPGELEKRRQLVGDDLVLLNGVDGRTGLGGDDEEQQQEASEEEEAEEAELSAVSKREAPSDLEGDSLRATLMQAPPPSTFTRRRLDQRQVAAAAAATRNRLLGIAIRLIRQGFFTRQQLIQYAAKLRQYLERQLRLSGGSILGLFPLDERRLLVELEASKLAASDLVSLRAMSAHFARAQAWLVLVWPKEEEEEEQELELDGDELGVGQQNPIPILEAILAALVSTWAPLDGVTWAP